MNRSEDLITSPRAVRIRWAGLAGREQGTESPAGPSIVFLHGLTFDRRMWDPVLEALPDRQRAIAFDLPGHGGSPALRRRGLAPVVDAIHEAVLDAGLDAPILVGHSIGGPLASIYAATYPAAGVVVVDAPIRFEPFAELFLSLRPQLEGEGFGRAWSMYQDSWHIELVPDPHRELLRAGEHGSQQVVLSYQSDLLDRPLDEVVRWRDAGLSRVRRAGTPYLTLHTSPVDPDERAWLSERLPQTEFVVWPVGHHFPHLADPRRFAALLSGFAARVTRPQGPPRSQPRSTPTQLRQIAAKLRKRRKRLLHVDGDPVYS
jgi:pimeloyl-ACP methyl ester carboxylesterase